MVQVVSSLLRWKPANVMTASSSGLVKYLYLCGLHTSMAEYYYFIHVCTSLLMTSMVESFEVVLSIYAQQLSLNETQTFTVPLLTLVAELVRKHLVITMSRIAAVSSLLSYIIYTYTEECWKPCWRWEKLCHRYCLVLEIQLYMLYKTILIQ